MTNKGKTVVLVDDEPDILEALAILLADEGYTVISDNGKHVEKKVWQHKPDIILLDVLLSGVNGGDITKHIKQNPLSAHIPIILMSAHPNAEKITKDSGADAFMPKPFEVKEILEKITEVLNKNSTN